MHDVAFRRKCDDARYVHWTSSSRGIFGACRRRCTRIPSEAVDLCSVSMKPDQHIDWPKLGRGLLSHDHGHVMLRRIHPVIVVLLRWKKIRSGRRRSVSEILHQLMYPIARHLLSLGGLREEEHFVSTDLSFSKSEQEVEISCSTAG